MDKFSRRSLIKRSLSVLGAVAAAPVISACSDSSGGGSLTCTDTASLTEPERAARTALHYADASPHGAAKNCVNCQYYTAAASGCGTCQLVKGPIHPSGYCDTWTAKS